MEKIAIKEVLLAALQTAGVGPAGVDRPALTAAIAAATDRELADALLLHLRECEEGKGSLEWQTLRLLSAAVAVSRQCCETAEKDANFSWAMKLLTAKQARIELRISFYPMRSVVGELIREEDGECVGQLFELHGRDPVAN